MVPYRWLTPFLLLLGFSPSIPGQAQPVPGVVWEPPASVDAAAFDLLRMREAGVQAVRTPVIEDDRLLTLADSLGLQFFQELPIDVAPVAVLEDTLEAVTRLLEQALAEAQSHPSARHFGLVRRSDTAAREACAVVVDLARRVRQYGPAGSQVYYVTTFVEADRCAEAADLVLLDRFDDASPPEALRRWQAAHPDQPVGLAALGTWVEVGAAGGLAVPLSAERQARYLETQLRALYAPAVRAPAVVFVHRWRDAEAVPLPLPAGTTDPFRLQAGLLTADGTPRPALAVMRGFYTDRQTVFAFDAGRPPRPSLPWPVLMGWLIAAVVGVSYAASIRFRRMVPRYFLAHGFYQEAVHSAREIPLVANGFVLGALCLSAGVAGTIWLDMLSREAAVAVFVRWLPEGAQEVLLSLLVQPPLLALLLGSLYALSLAVWMSALTMLARTRQRRLSAPQILSLVIWPRWPLLLLLAVALGLRTVAWPAAPWVLAGGYLVIVGAAVRRTLQDYASTFLASPGLLAAAVLVHPLLLILLFAAVAMVQRSSHALFLWHLLLYR